LLTPYAIIKMIIFFYGSCLHFQEDFNTLKYVLFVYPMSQGSFFRLQNIKGSTLVGLFMEGTTLTCLETYSDVKKRTML
jgi:hypothetical protein